MLSAGNKEKKVINEINSLKKQWYEILKTYYWGFSRAAAVLDAQKQNFNSNKALEIFAHIIDAFENFFLENKDGHVCILFSTKALDGKVRMFDYSNGEKLTEAALMYILIMFKQYIVENLSAYQQVVGYDSKLEDLKNTMESICKSYALE